MDCLREKKSGDSMEDLMRAKDILGAVKRNKERIDPAEEDGGVITGYRLAHDQITEIINRCIPTVLDVRPVVRGKWLHKEAYDFDEERWSSWAECSECGELAQVNGLGKYERSNFCPNCGADMREENHDNQR